MGKHLILSKGGVNVDFETLQAAKHIKEFLAFEGTRSEIDPIAVKNSQAAYMSRIRAIQYVKDHPEEVRARQERMSIIHERIKERGFEIIGVDFPYSHYAPIDS